MVSTGVLSKDVMQQTIVDELQKSITHPGVLLSILHPYNAPVVLTRAWCLVSNLHIQHLVRCIRYMCQLT